MQRLLFNILFNPLDSFNNLEILKTSFNMRTNKMSEVLSCLWSCVCKPGVLTHRGEEVGEDEKETEGLQTQTFSRKKDGHFSVVLLRSVGMQSAFYGRRNLRS